MIEEIKNWIKSIFFIILDVEKYQNMTFEKISKRKKNSKRLLYLFSFIIFVIILLGIIIKFPGNRTDENANRRRVNSLPIILDSYTRIDSIFEVGNRKIDYYLTINVSADNLDLSKNANIIIDNIIQSIRNDKDYNDWIAKQVTFEYRYFDKTGKFFFMKTITPEMYKKQ